MKFLIVIATLVYIAYDWASVKKNKNWPVSLSDTYYLTLRENYTGVY